MGFDDSVSIIFRIINFALVIGLTVYIFRRKFLHHIRSKIQEKEIFWHNLQTNKDMLIKQQKDLDDDIDWQHMHAQELLANIDRWRSVMDSYHEQEKEKAQEIAKNIAHRRMMQQDYACMDLLATTVTPRIMRRIRENLIKKFDEPRTSANYLDESIQRLLKE